jgi:hypothetical protein
MMFHATLHRATLGSPEQVQQDLIRVGRHMFDELQEELYPHLQSSPDAVIGERSTWVRHHHPTLPCCFSVLADRYLAWLLSDRLVHFIQDH